MTRRNHTHPCGNCKAPIECSGTYERNYDGFPEVICPPFDERTFPWLCEDCEEKNNAELAAEALTELEEMDVVPEDGDSRPDVVSEVDDSYLDIV